jgi:hypothetical protein
VNVGGGIAAFVKALRTTEDAELRRDIRSRSDSNVVKLIVSLADKASDLVNRDIVLALERATGSLRTTSASSRRSQSILRDGSRSLSRGRALPTRLCPGSNV